MAPGGRQEEGCTDPSGKAWSGRLSVERDGDDFTLSYDDFADKQGTFAVRRVESDFHEFDARLVIGSFTSINYKGTVRGRRDQHTVWDGAGSAERDGFLPPSGVIEATTVAEVVDDALCSGQPASGRTTLTFGSHVAVVTYDGATECDDEKTAALTVNGEAQAPLDGITCAVAQRGLPRSTLGLTLLGALVLAAVGRRRERVGTP
ncbi:MAG: hypothetical protein RJA70_324 [Pseudomonadota bacterium]|jgi:hypothetical protein